MPASITPIWNKSVKATETMPPASVYTSTIAVPITMPCHGAMAPLVSTENTSPSAVICADTQPRYEITIQMDVASSTPRV